MLSTKKPRFRKPLRLHPRHLQVEPLEPRRLLAAATLVEQQFRADDFTISGSFAYQQTFSAKHDMVDKLPNGSYTSLAGNPGSLVWTSPRNGVGYFQGQATGTGWTTVDGSKVNDYSLLETGRFDFSIDAAAAQTQLEMVSAVATAVNFTSYTDRSGGQYPRPIPTSHFFGGDPSSYTGTFDPATQKVSISFSQSQSSPPDWTSTTAASSPAATLQWSNQSATDMVLTINKSPITIPEGWIAVPPDSPPGTITAVDLAQGLEFTVDVQGQPVKTANVQLPVGTVHFYWAASDGDMTGAEIPVTSSDGALGVYWNSSRLHSSVKSFPAPAANASFLRVTVVAAGADAIASNSTRFLRIEQFQAGSGTSGPVSADSVLDGQTQSLLAAADVANPQIKVAAYAPASSLGAVLQVVNDRGGYRYDPTGAPAQIRALAAGESANDVVQFLAVKNDAAVSLASHTITVTGVNDAPAAATDSAATKSFQKLLLASSALLANDTDVDHNDVLAVSAVAGTSQQGAAIQAILDNSQIVQIEYDPTASSQLRGLAPGQQQSDEFTYEIVDLQGAKATGRVLITVTGSQLLTISSVLPQYTSSVQPTAPIPIAIGDPDGKAGSLQLSGQAVNPSLIANLEFTGTGQQRQLVITPSGTTGETQIQLTVSNALGQSTSTSLSLVVYSTQDSDLDGVPDAVEDAGPNSGDMNTDGLADSTQANVAALRGYGSAAFFCLTVPAAQTFSSVAVASPAPAANAQFPLGLLQFELLTDSPGALRTVMLRTNLPTPALNRFFQYEAPAGGGVGWQSFMDSGNGGARVFADRIEIGLRDGGRGDQDQLADGRIVVVGAPAHVARPWQNDQPADANNDGLVTPLDVLVLIAQYNLTRGGPLGELPAGTDSLPPFLDTSGDDFFSPVDVLTVISHLNQVAAGEGEPIFPLLAPSLPDSSVSLGLIFALPSANAGADAHTGDSTANSLAVPAAVTPPSRREFMTFQRANPVSELDEFFTEIGRFVEL